MRLNGGIVLNLVVVLVIALLFLDLASLTNDTSCTLETDPRCPDVYFAQDYFTARTRFLRFAKELGAKVDSYVVYVEDDVEYTMEVATLKGANPKKAVVHVTGVGGATGYAGAAVQLQYMDALKNRTEPVLPTVVFVFAVNPYGMAHFRRFNEDNVELNRNFLLEAGEWATVLGQDKDQNGYEFWREILNPQFTMPTLFHRYKLMLDGVLYSAFHGWASLRKAFLSGQYHDPHGLMYGGRKLSASLRMLKSALEKQNDVEEVVVIDMHVGLGRHGTQTLMVVNDEDHAMAAKVFNDSEIVVRSRQTGISDGFEAVHGSVRYSRIFKAKKVVEVMQDLGTYPQILVGRALILEHAAFQCCRGTHVHAMAAASFRDSVYIQDLHWKRSILDAGVKTLVDAERYHSENSP